MKIVLAPDSFKGSMTATQACRAMEIGVRRVFPDAEIIGIPLADGGEGTLDALMTATGGTIKSTVVRDPLGRSIKARWGITSTGQAVIEMAEASGLNLVAAERRDALAASSYGTGQLIKTALDAGCREIILGIGGSATTDGGIGALSALGLYARDARQRVLAPGGGSMGALAQIDLKFLDARLAKTDFIVLCDVNNPLYGPQGAAHIYAKQKGASSDQITLLDDGLKRYAHISESLTQSNWKNHPGAGAAGGIGYGLMTFCHAELRSGIEVVLDLTQFASKITGADLVLTGEGSLDVQTLNGKTVAGICRIAQTHSIPVVAFGGNMELTVAEMDDLGLLTTFALVNGPRTLHYCLQHGPSLLINSVAQALRLRTQL